jgi:hypothetical protein
MRRFPVLAGYCQVDPGIADLHRAELGYGAVDLNDMKRGSVVAPRGLEGLKPRVERFNRSAAVTGRADVKRFTSTETVCKR